MEEQRTVLAAEAEKSGGHLALYCGALTAEHFGDTAQEFRTLLTGCAVYDLGWRGKLTFRGEDRVRWLNGMVTNNVRDLAPDHGNYNFVLNSQGRILGDLYIYNRGDVLLGDTELWQVEPLRKLLDHFVVMDDVEIAVSTDMTSIGVQGPRATETLQALGIEPSCADPLVVCDLQWHGRNISVTRMVGDEHITYELWLEPSAAVEMWSALVAAGAQPTGWAALEKFRVMMAMPRYGNDIRERDLPQETGQDSALNFSKGCYLGQEIVERIRSRGQVHRTFTGFIMDEPVAPGAKIRVGDKDVGELTSFQLVRLPAAGEERNLALGYLRREFAAPGTEITAMDGERAVAGKVAKTPFS